jgi:hypothetical protein
MLILEVVMALRACKFAPRATNLNVTDNETAWELPRDHLLAAMPLRIMRRFRSLVAMLGDRVVRRTRLARPRSPFRRLHRSGRPCRAARHVDPSALQDCSIFVATFGRFECL